MLKEYDFSGGVRGKYANRILTRANVVVLDEDVAQVYHDSEAVNRVLRELIATKAGKAAGPRAQTE